jgi:membrane protein implicated in regulation of membrane protease activity
MRLGLMKKAALILGIIFLALTFVGGGYVLINYGKVNAGYAVVPGSWAMICFGFYRSRKRD